MSKITYNTRGTCSRQIVIDLDGQIVRSVEFVGGCTGNLLGLSALLRGRRIDRVISLLEGIQCQNGTSCPDQLAKALRQAPPPEKQK